MHVHYVNVTFTVFWVYVDRTETSYIAICISGAFCVRFYYSVCKKHLKKIFGSELVFPLDQEIKE